MLPGTDLAAAGSFAERLRARVAQSEVPVGSQVLTLTVSIGASAVMASDADGKAALNRANEAKPAGRNCVRLDAKAAGRASADHAVNAAATVGPHGHGPGGDSWCDERA